MQCVSIITVQRMLSKRNTFSRREIKEIKQLETGKLQIEWKTIYDYERSSIDNYGSKIMCIINTVYYTRYVEHFEISSTV